MHRGGLLAAFLAGPRHMPPTVIAGQGEQAAQVAEWATARRRTHSLASRTLERGSQDESGRLLERPMWRTRLELEQKYQPSLPGHKLQMEWIPAVAPRTIPKDSAEPSVARLDTNEDGRLSPMPSTSQPSGRWSIRKDQKGPDQGSIVCPPVPSSEPRHSSKAVANVVKHKSASPYYLLPDHLQVLLRTRQFRHLVFTLLRDPLLRSNEKLVRQIGRLLASVAKDSATSSAGAARLALRLGYVKGRRRGPAWEDLHQVEVIQQGRLPSEDRVRKAMALDVRSELVLPRRAKVKSSISRSDSKSWMEERWTIYYNTLLDRYLTRAGGKPTSGFRISPPPDTHPPARSGHDPPRPPSRTPLPVPPPSLDLRPLSRLVLVIEKLRNTRGFEPNGVTAAILLKCWIRCLSVQPVVKDHHGLWSGGKDLWDLFEKTEMVVKGMDRRSSKSLPAVTDNKVVLESLLTNSTNVVDYKTHIRPIGRMFVKAFRGKGRHDMSGKVMAWMREYKATEEGQGTATDKHE